MPRLSVLPNLAPARLDLQVYRGDTFRMRMMLKSGGLPVAVVPQGQYSWEFTAQIRATFDGPVITFFDVEVVGEKTGFLRLYLAPDQSQLLPSKSLWDLQSVDPNLRTRTLVRGEIVCTPDVTHNN